MGEQHPVVLVIEDLHLADAATRALMTFLARIAREQRLAIIGTHQPDVVGRDDPWTADLGSILAGPREPDRLTLTPLDRDELAALIEGIEENGHRPVCCSSSQSVPAASRWSPRSCWPPAASCRARR